MRRHLSRWHRRIGLISLVLLAWLALTGFALNHPERFGLNKAISSAALARWYGISADCAESGWAVGEQQIIDCGSRVWLDTRQLPLRGPVAGALRWQDMMVVAGSDGLSLLTTQGALVERIDASLLPGQIKRIGTLGDQLVLSTSAGEFRSSAALSRWDSLDAPARWAPEILTDAALREQLALLTASSELTRERLLQDLHSGRIIGFGGRLLADFGALSILALATLGLILTRRSS